MTFYNTETEGRILVVHPGEGIHSVLLATAKEKQKYNYNCKTLEEINLDTLTYLYPHFPKFLKNILQIEK